MAALDAQGESFLKIEIRALYAGQSLPEY